jgi:putative hemolysin
MAPFDEVTKLLDLEPEDADEYDTLNGFLISLIDRIPNEDERISVDAFGYRFEIESVENKMIKSVRAFAAEPSREESSQDAEAVPV